MIDLFHIEKNNFKSEYKDSDMAIIGVSIHMPLTDSLDDLYSILSKKIECIGNISEYRKKDIIDYLTSKGQKNINFLQEGYLEHIDLFAPELFKITPYEAKLMNPNQRLSLMSMYEAIEDSGYNGGRLNGTKTGVFVGYVELDGYKYRDIIVDNCTKDDIDICAIGNLNSMIPSRISYFLDLKGPCFLIDTACSSSLTALYLACKSIESGDCDQAVVSASRLNILPYEDGLSIGMESKNSCIRTFDNSADGTVKGEGCISIIIKPVKKAIVDKDNIYAVIKGGAINQDGATMGITAPNAEAQKEVILEAWKKSEISPEKIGVIEAHGTGTKLGDVIEIDGLNKAFSKYTSKKQFCAIGSVKTNYGHMYDVAGLAGIVKCIVQLKTHKILPSNNFDVPNKNINFENTALYVCDKEVDWNVHDEKRICAISSFGFSGTNCHMVLEEYPTNYEKIYEKYHVLALSAYTKESLINLLKRYYDYFLVHYSEPLSLICYTANKFRSQEKERIVFVFKNLHEINEMLIEAIVDNNLHTKRYYENGIEIDHAVLEQVNRFLDGEKTDWSALYNKKYQKISVPYAPLPLKRFWIDVNTNENINDKVQKKIFSQNLDYDTVVESLLKIVRDLLEMPSITASDNLLDIGVDSILMLKLQKQIDEVFPGIVTLSKMFTYSTISSMAKYICEQNKDEKQVVKSELIDPIEVFLSKDDDLLNTNDSNESDIETEDLTVEQLLEKIKNL